MNPSIQPQGRTLHSMPELRDMVTDVSARMDALCELLGKASGTQVQVDSIRVLLQPLQAQLDTACCDLHEMRL